ncbi:MAG: DJ-1/PfpI family protein, partial [Acidobacteriota bacterium]|nr:DJ-1/PfpI family protein [Acidobacteriota bacterium]
VYTVSKTREPIVSQGFVDVVPDYSIADAPKPDIIVLPGGGTGSVLGDEEFTDWVVAAARDAEIAMSVCTGAFLLGRAGLLEDKDVTTWYGAIGRLEEQYPTARVHRGRRLVDNGQVVTTAGVSAGIDGSLHVIARLLGRYVADRTAQYMEYRWTPEPYLAQGYSILNPSLDADGRKRQQISIDLAAGNYEVARTALESLVSEDPEDTEAWFALGIACYGSGRYDRGVEAYERAATDPDVRARALYNAACCAALDGEADTAFGFLDRVVEAGYTDFAYMAGDDDLTSLRDDPRWEQLRTRLAEPSAQ